MADTLTTKDRLTRENQVYLTKVVCDMGTFRDRGSKALGELCFMLRFDEEWQLSVSKIGLQGYQSNAKKLGGLIRPVCSDSSLCLCLISFL
jgi:hypothetical protein